MSKLGRKEILTDDLAKKICKMIERMPDASIPINWVNVSTHVARQFHHRFNRQILSQKEWQGRKLISEAFHEAKSIQKRMQFDPAPKYQTSPRSLLQSRIVQLEAKILALQDELEFIRAQQLDSLDVFLNTRCDLQALLKKI